MAKAMTNVQRAFQVLSELRPTNDPITLTEWREGCAEWIGPRKATMYDVRSTLLARGQITIDDAGLIRRTGASWQKPARAVRAVRKPTYDGDLKEIAELLRRILAAVEKPSI